MLFHSVWLNGVEEFRTEFQFAAAALAEHERFKQREVPVLTAGTTNELKGTLPQVPATVGAKGPLLRVYVLLSVPTAVAGGCQTNWSPSSEKLTLPVTLGRLLALGMMLLMFLCRAANPGTSRIVGLTIGRSSWIAAFSDIERFARRLQSDDTRHLPSADRRLQQLVGAVSENGDVVDEVDERRCASDPGRMGRCRSAIVRI